MSEWPAVIDTRKLTVVDPASASVWYYSQRSDYFQNWLLRDFSIRFQSIPTTRESLYTLRDVCNAEMLARTGRLDFWNLPTPDALAWLQAFAQAIRANSPSFPGWEATLPANDDDRALQDLYRDLLVPWPVFFNRFVANYGGANDADTRAGWVWDYLAQRFPGAMRVRQIPGDTKPYNFDGGLLFRDTVRYVDETQIAFPDIFDDYAPSVAGFYLDALETRFDSASGKRVPANLAHPGVQLSAFFPESSRLRVILARILYALRPSAFDIVPPPFYGYDVFNGKRTLYNYGLWCETVLACHARLIDGQEPGPQAPAYNEQYRDENFLRKYGKALVILGGTLLAGGIVARAFSFTSPGEAITRQLAKPLQIPANAAGQFFTAPDALTGAVNAGQYLGTEYARQKIGQAIQGEILSAVMGAPGPSGAPDAYPEAMTIEPEPAPVVKPAQSGGGWLLPLAVIAALLT